MSFFTACSDDDDASPANDISKEYKSEELHVTSGGEEISGGAIKVEAIDNSNVKLTLTNVVNGHASFDMNAAVAQSGSEYTFKGNKDIDGMKVTVVGTVNGGKAEVETSAEITSAEILKSWNFAPAGWLDATLIFNIETKDGLINVYDEEGKLSESDAKEYSDGIAMMGGSIFSVAFSNDFAFTFNKNGYVGIKGKSNFSPEGSQDINIPKLARYYYNPTTKVLTFDAPLDGLLAGLTKANANSALSGTLYVPFICTFREDGKLEAAIDPKFIAPFLPLIPKGEALDGLLGMLDSVMPAEMADLLPWLKANIKTIAEALTSDNLKQFTLGCKLAPVK